jgi:hypothetical protein
MALMVVGPVFASPAAAASFPQPSPTPDSPVVVDGTHFPALQEINERLQKTAPDGVLSSLSVAHPTPPLGTSVGFWSWDFAYGSFHALTATLKASGEYVDIYIENQYPVAQSVISEMARLADATVLRERQAFGMEPSPGVDGNRHVTILLLNIRDGQFYAAGGPLVGGYFWYLNQYTQANLDSWYPGAGYKSNEREMIFVDCLATMPGTRESYQVLAHEFQHMIHWNLDFDEDGWLNEGMSNLAASLSGFGLPTGHAQAFLNAPNKTLTSSTANPLADYGGYGLFGLYLWEKYGGDAFTKDLVSTAANGAASIDAVLARRQQRDRFAQVVAHWAVANFLDDPNLFAYQGIDITPNAGDGVRTLRRPPVAAAHTTYPSGVVTTTVAAWAAEYITLGNLGQGDLVITMTAGMSTIITINVITSTSSSFATGTNTLREVTLQPRQTTTLRLAGAGAAFTSVLLIPVHVSQATQQGQFIYSAELIARATPSPTPSPTATVSPTPTQSPTPSPTATPVATATPAESEAPAPTATPTESTTPAESEAPAPTVTPTESATPPPTATPVAPTPIAYTMLINCGGTDYVAGETTVWKSDRAYSAGGAGYVGGQTNTVKKAIGATTDDVVYQNERWGLSAYKFDVPNGVYTVTLGFAETYYAKANSRVFDVKIGDRTVLTKFDIFAAASGADRAVTRTFRAEVSNGQLAVYFVDVKATATIQAISVESAE